jgi:hypothetical protein
MNDQRPTPETDAENAQFPMGGYTLDFCRKLERERDEAREESKMWKANHDNQVKLKSALMDRHDLGDRARKVVALAKERDEARERERVAIASWDEERQRALREGERVVEARELARELRDAFERFYGFPNCSKARLLAQEALAKAKEVLP